MMDGPARIPPEDSHLLPCGPLVFGSYSAYIPLIFRYYSAPEERSHGEEPFARAEQPGVRPWKRFPTTWLPGL